MIVNASLDIGVNDATTITFFTGDPIIVDYEEITGGGMDKAFGKIFERGYEIGHIIFPHDGRVREWGSGALRRSEIAWLDYGIRVYVCPRISESDMIGVARNFFKIIKVDKKKCERLLDCLQSYREEYNVRTGSFTGRPVHDWSSHGAKSFIYAAMAYFSGDLDFKNYSSLKMELLEKCARGSN
jgi:hypothetical protein